MRGWRLGLCFSCAPARVPRSNVQQTPITPTTGPISSQRIKPTIGIGTCLLHDPFWVLLWVLHWKAPCHSLSLLNFITAWRPSANLDSDVVPCSCSSRRHVESWWPNKHLQAATTGHNSTFRLSPGALVGQALPVAASKRGVFTRAVVDTKHQGSALAGHLKPILVDPWNERGGRRAVEG